MRKIIEDRLFIPKRLTMTLKMSIFIFFVFSFSLLANEAGPTNSTSGFGNDLPETGNFSDAGQQQIIVVGRVVDENGETLPGVNVTVKGTVIGVMTDVNGNYSINVPSRDAVLQFSFIGYDMQEVTVGNQSTINVTLGEDVQMLEEVVVVGYGVQKKETLTGAVSQISSDDIVSTKQADAVASLQGKIPGLLIRQASTKPGGFASELSLRGYGAPMIVVDGVVRSGAVFAKNTNPWGGSATSTVNDMSALQEINPDDIESISVLKDAAAAIYGLGAANGVILITTKKGKEGAPSISYSNQFIFSRPATIRKTEDWVSFMEWDNAMADVAKMSHRFTPELIEHYRNNDEGYVYTDWYDLLTKNFASTMTHNLSLRGGSDRVTYYFGAGYSDDKTIFVTDGYKYQRFSINGNVTAKLTSDLTLRYQTSMRFTEKSEPGSGDVEWNLLYYVHATNPMVGPKVKDNPDHYSNVEEQMNPMALLDTDLMNSITNDKSYQNTVDLTYQAPFLEGLQFVATGAFDYSTSKNRTLIRRFDLYDYHTDVYAASFRENTNYRELWIDNSRLYGRIQANYTKKFDRHDVNATLAWEATVNKSANVFARRLYGATAAESFYTHDIIDQGLSSTATNSGTRNSRATQGILGRLNYSYAGKYLVELMGRYDGTYFYAPGKRWGFFPSYSVGWRISEEAFMKDNLPWISNLKLRWSDGFTGSTQGGAYAYIGGYTQSGSWIFSEGATVNGWNSTTVENTILTWADVRMMDAGVDFDLWKSKFGGSFDWFKRKTTGISATRTASLPDFYGVSLPSENLNESENVGLELSLSYREKIGDLNLRVSTSGTFSRFRYTYLERARTDTYASSMAYWSSNNIEGRWSNARAATTWEWADGSQFQSLGDISEESVLYSTRDANRTLVPGMYRLDDRDGDGYITNDDRYYKWSQSNPPLQYGLTISGDYKNLDFNIVFSGGALHSKTLGLSSYAGFGYLYYLPKLYTEDCWSVANYGDDPWDPNTEWNSGFWPALCRVNRAGSSHNATYTSNQPYNFINATYLRLKTVELGYTFKPALLNKIGVKSARLYVNGGNLHTFCNKLLKHIDPESNDNGRQGGYFQPTKTFSFGVNLNF
jgi:TonB-linked SusC/RagA family outer membrane protein